MQTEVFDHLLLIAAVLCAASLVRLIRGNDGLGRGYSIVVGGLLIASVLAMGADVFFGVVVIGLVLATVAAPWVLEQAARRAFAWGRMVWVVRLTSLRAILMPGAGVSAQLPILEGLALLEREGVDAGLIHLRKLADEAEEDAELAVIHEQIIAMFFYGHRWDEGIAHYERRFSPGYAALRPSLALGLLRAYGEAGRLGAAAGLLRALEEGPMGADPKAAGVIGQARLTFLAYAGAVEPLDELVRARRFSDLGLSRATAELLRGIAQDRAGEPQRAVETLEQIEAIAGRRDHRVIEAARSVLARVSAALDGSLVGGQGVGERGDGDSDGASELGPDLRVYVELVAVRLRELLRALPAGGARTRPRATYALIALMAMIYGVHLLRGGGSMALLGLGALSEDLLLAGGVSAWARVVTSAWIHVDLVSLLFDVYAIWMAGQLVERLLGPARMILVSVGAALIGLLASVLALPWLWESGLEVLAVVPATSGTLMAIGTTTAGLCCLLPSRTPGLSSRARRNLGITFSLLLFANMLLGWPGLPGVGVAPVALLVCVLVASAAAILPVGMQGPGQWLIRGLAGLLLALSVFAGGVVASAQGEDPQAYLAEHRMQRCRFDEVVVDTPFHFTPMVFNEQGYDRQVPFELPALEGLVDELELRSGGLVQLAVMHDPSPGVAAEMATDAVGASEGSPALLDAVGILDRELERSAPGTLPVPLAAAIAADDTGSWQAHDLWRNGERAGRLIERRIPAAAGEGAYVVVLLAAPAEALEHAPSLYAAMLGDVSVDLQAEQTQADGAFVRPHCTVE